MTDKIEVSAIGNDKSADGWTIYRRLTGYVRPYVAMLLLGILGSALFAGADLALIKSFEFLIDDILIGKDQGKAFWAPFVLIILVIFRGVANIISSYAMAWTGNRVVMDIRTALFSHLLRLPVAYFDQTSGGELIAKVTYNTEKVMQAVTKALQTLVKEGLMVIGALAMSFYISWKLTLIFCLTGPIIALAVVTATKRFRAVSKRIQSAVGDVASVSEEAVEGNKVVKTFNGFEYENQRFYHAADQNRLNNVKLNVAQSASVAFIQLVASIGLAFVLWYSIKEVTSGQLTPGQLTEILMLMLSLLKPVKQLTNVNSVIQQAVAAGESIFEVLDLEKEQDTGQKSIERTKGHIEVENLCFSYPGNQSQVLKQVSFEIEPGNTLALVGRSGSGKTSITQVLLRFYQTYQGQIKLDGTSIQDYKLDDFRKQVALVGQQVALFNDTIAANIAYANEGATEQEIIEAAKAAHAWEFIQQQPHGLQTMVGENGLMLSGGQRQRLAIARAILKKAPILILDEATSALDTESERYIQDALDTLLENTTAIVVAHRLSTIENADQILVLDQGHVIEQGSHQQLMQAKGEYHRLHSMQFADS